MRPKDRVFVYHSMSQPAVVGVAEVVSEASADPKDPKAWVISMRFLGRLEPPTTLTEIKESGLFNDWSLIGQTRVSRMPVPGEFADWMRKRYPKRKI